MERKAFMKGIRAHIRTESNWVHLNGREMKVCSVSIIHKEFCSVLVRKF